MGDVNSTSEEDEEDLQNANAAVGGCQQQQQLREQEHQPRVELTAIESFTESIFALKNKQLQPQRDSSESAVSSFAEEALSPTALLYPHNHHHNNIDNSLAETESLEGISLQLRPTLPKKQFEIPRFSPAAAWRLLTTAETAREVTSMLKDRMEDQQSDGGSLNSGDDASHERNQEVEVTPFEKQLMSFNHSELNQIFFHFPVTQ